MGIREKLADTSGEEDFLFADGFDNAIIGFCLGFDSGRVVYDARKMVRILSQKEEMTRDEAWEYLEFNTFGAWVGDNTPIYVMQRDYWDG